MKKCGRCGKGNRAEDNFCRDCGAPLNASKQAIPERENLLERFKKSNMIVKLMFIVAAAFIMLMILGLASNLLLGTPIDSYSEEAEAKNLIDFNAIDMDSDGALTYEEADGYAPEIDHDELREIFDEADSNHNGVLIGGEFDLYVQKTKQYHDELEKQKKNEEQNDKSDSPSIKVPTVKLGKCPSCGSSADYMYDYYDEFGRPYYQCTVCDYWTYDEGEFYDEP